MGHTHFGYWGGFSTNDALYSIQVLFQRSRDVLVPVYAYFIDYQKAFVGLLQGKLIETQKKIDLDDRDLNGTRLSK